MDTIIAKQFTPIYDPKEDRIRLIINLNYPDRYDVWITRNFLIKILDHLQNFFAKHNIEFDYNFNNNSTNTSNKEMPIYENQNTPELLESFTLTKDKDKFILILKDSKNTIQAVLGENELKQLILFIVNSVNLEWGVGAFL